MAHPMDRKSAEAAMRVPDRRFTGSVFIRSLLKCNGLANLEVMDPVQGSSLDYPVAVLARAEQQQRVDGRNAVKLIEAAQPDPRARPLPPDATYSIYA